MYFHCSISTSFVVLLTCHEMHFPIFIVDDKNPDENIQQTEETTGVTGYLSGFTAAVQSTVSNHCL